MHNWHNYKNHFNYENHSFLLKNAPVGVSVSFVLDAFQAAAAWQGTDLF